MCPEDRSLERDANLWPRGYLGPILEPPTSSARRLGDHVGDFPFGGASSASDASDLHFRGSHPQVYDSASTTPSPWYPVTVSQQPGAQLYQGFTVVSSADSANGWVTTAAGRSASHDKSEIIQRTRPLSSAGLSSWQSNQNIVSMREGVFCHQPDYHLSETPSTSKSTRPRAPRRSIKNSPTLVSATKKSTRIPHNLIERRYRRNLQVQLDHLASKIPGWVTGSLRELDIENADFAVHRRSKASAMAAAAKYIDDLERDMAQRDNFVTALQEQIQGLQKLVNCDDCAIVRNLQANARYPSSDLLREYGSADIPAS